MKKSDQRPRPCANEGCARSASSGDLLCETCSLERSLYRRSERGGFRDPGELLASAAATRALGRIGADPIEQ